MARKIALDTETTGLEIEKGHRIIEIGAVELIDRRPIGRRYHQYINPEREIDLKAQHVHGISIEQLEDEPKFSEIADEFVEFIRGAELIIHNAPFDVGFLNYELSLCGHSVRKVESIAKITDTLALAKVLHPNQRVSLDALCRRYQIDTTAREFHGGLIDALILADLYIAMTGGQSTLNLDEKREEENPLAALVKTKSKGDLASLSLPVIEASQEELSNHGELLARLDQKSGGKALWLREALKACLDFEVEQEKK
jgi:DNA polymerase-3 subunit epsilon